MSPLFFDLLCPICFDDVQAIVITANHYMATDEVDLNADYVMYKPIDIEEFALFAQRLVAFKNRAQG
jgi:hypothetical protein